MRTHASLRLGNVCGTTPELLGSYRGSVCLLSVAPCVAFGALVWPGKRDSPPRPPLLPLNAGTAEPFRVSPPEAVAYQLTEGCAQRPGPFSFRREVANQAQNELKGFVPRGASPRRHAPIPQNPCMKADSHDTTAPSAHRGLL